MEKVRPWCGQPSDRGRLKIRSDAKIYKVVNQMPDQFRLQAVVNLPGSKELVR